MQNVSRNSYDFDSFEILTILPARYQSPIDTLPEKAGSYEVISKKWTAASS